MGMFAEKLVTLRDPICGMTLDPGTANGTSIGRKTYFFCSAFCRSRFDADPRNAFMEPLAAVIPSREDGEGSGRGALNRPQIPDYPR
jgi:YHS domain-containing protein